MDLETLKLRLQGFLRDGLVIVIGSGLSCAEGLPGMGELAQHLCEHVGDELAAPDTAVWEGTVPLIGTKGLEAALLEKPPSPRLEAAIVKWTAALMAARERAVITEVFNGTRTLRLTRLIPHVLKPTSGIPIITTNYDRLVEIAVEEAQLGVDTQFVGRFAARVCERESHLSFCRNVTLRNKRPILHYQDRALVYKPHGSLDWYLRNDAPVQYFGDLDGVTRLLITPGYNKFRNGYESPFDHHRSKANEAIDRALRYLIIGYGFNDDHLETHLTPQIKNGKPTLLITRSLSKSAKDIVRQNSNAIALEYMSTDKIEGTRVITGTDEFSFPNVALWDLKAFVTEVLQ